MMDEYTCGAKYICRKLGEDNYEKIAQCLPGKEESKEWAEFADRVVELLNQSPK